MFARRLLQPSDDICHVDVRWYFDLDVYMILVGVQCLDPERRVFLHRGVETFPEFDENVGLQEFPSVLRTPYDMVLVLIRGVVQLTGPHGTSVSRPKVVYT